MPREQAKGLADNGRWAVDGMETGFMSRYPSNKVDTGRSGPPRPRRTGHYTAPAHWREATVIKTTG